VFEVGFSEMLLIMALALIVLGPEKLPKLAAQVGRWMGRARNMARQFREQLEEEAILEETRPKRPAKAASTSTPAPAPAPVPTSAQAPAATDAEDTRHSDYVGAAYEPPAPVASGAEPGTADAQQSKDDGGRGA
jgi:Tat protein translocase TatB subunit